MSGFVPRLGTAVIIESSVPALAMARRRTAGLGARQPGSPARHSAPEPLSVFGLRSIGRYVVDISYLSYRLCWFHRTWFAGSLREKNCCGLWTAVDSPTRRIFAFSALDLRPATARPQAKTSRKQASDKFYIRFLRSQLIGLLSRAFFTLRCKTEVPPRAGPFSIHWLLCR